MRRLTTALPVALLTAAAVLTLSAGTAVAAGSERGHGKASSHSERADKHGKDSRHAADHSKKAKGKQNKADKRHEGDRSEHGRKDSKAVVTFTGILSDTPTATIGSDTATSTIKITVTVKGGARELHGRTVVVTLDRFTVVRRGDHAAQAGDLAKGDHVSVRARRMPDGSWLGLRVNASESRRHERAKHDD